MRGGARRAKYARACLHGALVRVPPRRAPSWGAPAAVAAAAAARAKTRCFAQIGWGVWRVARGVGRGAGRRDMSPLLFLPGAAVTSARPLHTERM